MRPAIAAVHSPIRMLSITTSSNGRLPGAVMSEEMASATACPLTIRPNIVWAPFKWVVGTTVIKNWLTLR